MNSVLNIALVLRDSASRGLEKAAGAVAQLGTMGLEAARKLEAVGGALEGAFDESLTLYERVMGKGVDSAAELEKAMARLEMNLDAGSLTLVDDLERAPGGCSARLSLGGSCRGGGGHFNDTV